MRITDLLDVRSISLDAAPKSKQEALDGAPVDLLFLIAAPDTKDNIHLDVRGIYNICYNTM